MRSNRKVAEAGSLDMLLDTMCNTFGGICFIALLLAIFSAALPKTVQDADSPAKLLEEERLARLARERDEIAGAVALWKELTTNGIPVDSVPESLPEGEDPEVLRERTEALEKEILRRKTDAEYNRREAERLRLVLAELQGKLEEERERRTRLVRIPMEHELAGWRPLDVWLKDGRFRVLSDSRDVAVREKGFGDNTTWTYRVAGRGLPVDAAFWESGAWRKLAGELKGRSFLRIYSDRESFPELCRLRDRLAESGMRYNWHWTEEDELLFFVGVDSRVQ